MPLPIEIIGLKIPQITLIWEDEHQTTYNARDLRLRCRCAFCIEELSGTPILDPSSIPLQIVANFIEVLGQYAINIKWSDGHDTSIYNFRDLRKNCSCSLCK